MKYSSIYCVRKSAFRNGHLVKYPTAGWLALSYNIMILVYLCSEKLPLKNGFVNEQIFTLC